MDGKMPLMSENSKMKRNLKKYLSTSLVCNFLFHFRNRSICVTVYDLPMLKIFLLHKIKINLKGMFSQKSFVLDLNSKGGPFLKQKSKCFKNVHLRHKYSVKFRKKM